ncbi:alpha/beta hydrolase [Vacuolonema iberomarrocanum]|uniref:alpha/beta hydrolase n=1 Tax=Vacuolonema iberomarrocanum TaxID=3454632 RepID=UPI003F6DF771
MMSPAMAAEEVVLTYGILQAAFPVEDFRTLAETGEPPSSIAFYLDLAGIEPATAQNTLLSPVALSPQFLNALGTEQGDQLLVRLIDVVHTSSGEGSVPALRSAILQAASADQQITLLELMEYYPNTQMFINGTNLTDLMQDLSEVQGLVEGS